jgi:hypothetical protein
MTMRTLALLVVLALALGCDAVPGSPASAAPPTKDAAAAPVEPDTIVIPSIAGVVSVGWAPNWSGFAGTNTGCMRSSGMGRFAVAPALTEGDRMLSLTAAMIGNLSADVTITSVAVAPNGDRFLGTVGSLSVPNVPGFWSDFTIDLADTLIAGGNVHWFEFDADQAGACVGAVRLTYDHPGR